MFACSLYASIPFIVSNFLQSIVMKDFHAASVERVCVLLEAQRAEWEVAWYRNEAGLSPPCIPSSYISDGRLVDRDVIASRSLLPTYVREL